MVGLRVCYMEGIYSSCRKDKLWVGRKYVVIFILKNFGLVDFLGKIFGGGMFYIFFVILKFT